MGLLNTTQALYVKESARHMVPTQFPDVRKKENPKKFEEGTASEIL